MNKNLFGPKEDFNINTNDNLIESKPRFLDPDENLCKIKETRNLADFQRNPILLSSLRKFIKKITKHSSFYYIKSLKDYHYNLISDESICHHEVKNQISIQMKFINFIGKFIISPYHPLRIFWSIFLSFYLIFSFIYVPLEISFQFQGLFSEMINFIAVVVFSLDIGISLITGHFINGCLLLEPEKVFKHYLKTLFVSDILGLISVIYSFLFINQFFNYNLFSLGKLIVFYKAKKLYWSIRILSNYFKIEYQYKGYVDLIKVMSASLLIAHLIACLWHMLGNSDTQANWLIALNISHEDWSKKYIYSIYWAVTTMMTVGYGDIVPKNGSETLFATIVIVFGCVVYGYNLNSVGMVVQEIYKNENQFKSTLKAINSFMNRKKIDNNLQTRVQEYLYFIWKEQKLNDNEEEMRVINNLSESLKDELLIQAYGGIFKKFPLLVKYFSQKSLTKVISAIKEIKFIPGDEVFEVFN